MPFFLVTQTSLIEATDEQNAAQKGVDQIRSGGQVTVTVKSDEASVSRIVVAKAHDQRQSPEITVIEPDHPLPPEIDATPARGLDRKLILKRMIGDALALLSWKA